MGSLPPGVTKKAGRCTMTPPTPDCMLVIESAFLTRFRSEAVQTGMDTRRATEGSAGVLDSTSRSLTERNAVDMPGSAAAVESW